MVLISLPTHVGLAGVRDITVADIDAFIHYWHYSGDEHLNFLGIDRKKLGTPEDTRQRFLHSIRTGEIDQPNVGFAITVDGALVGYTNLNRYTADDNYPHLHVTSPSFRAVGVATVLFPYILKLFFDLFPIRRLILQPRTRNVGINRVLDKYLTIAETRYFEDPDGVAGPGEFHMRYLLAGDIPELLRKATFFQREKQRDHSRQQSGDRIRDHA